MSLSQVIRTVLISVSNKTGLLELARYFQHKNITILSTGGTGNYLSEHKIPFIKMSDYIDFPEVLDGRVKTLHPKIQAGILARKQQDEAILAQHNIRFIDLVIVNLYPFIETIKNPNSTPEEIIENIDIGGPTLIRAAAKNFAHVGVIVSPDDYQPILQTLANNQDQLTQENRKRLAKKAFQYVAEYDIHIANYFEQHNNDQLPDPLFLSLHKTQHLRYGENQHQQAGVYTSQASSDFVIHSKHQLQGKPLSYNNINDASAALSCLLEFSECTCVIVKHTNPCGVALDQNDNCINAYSKAYQCDSTSAFGGIIAINRAIDEKTAEFICNHQYIEVFIAPHFSENALAIFKTKPNVRLLTYPQGLTLSKNSINIHSIMNGYLIQEDDHKTITEQELTTVSHQRPTIHQLNDALFAWKVCKHVKSNAIVLAKNLAIIGIGAGQMSRIDSTQLSIKKALEQNHELKGCVLASDAFFPFKDNIQYIQSYGISGIIQPGGSIKDEEIIQAVNEYNMFMTLTHYRHFKH